MQGGDLLSRFGVEVRTEQFRVSHKDFDVMSTPPLEFQGGGRFDDPSDSMEHESQRYRVLYTGESAKSAFLETLARYRYRLKTIESMLADTMLSVDERDDAAASQGDSGVIPSDWQQKFQLTKGRIMTSAPVFDLTRADSVQTLRTYLAPSLIALGLEDLDFSHVLSDNRDLTRAISRWLWTMTTQSGEPLFSGIRYCSRFDPECICLALYEGRFSIDGDIDIQPITPETPGFAEAASILRLQIA